MVEGTAVYDRILQFSVLQTSISRYGDPTYIGSEIKILEVFKEARYPYQNMAPKPTANSLSSETSSSSSSSSSQPSKTSFSISTALLLFACSSGINSLFYA
jgi:hypothetical protein